MRPTSDELLTGIRHVLEDVLFPELQSPWAISMATQMAFMLEHLTGRAEREPQFLADENRRLAAVLAKASASTGRSEAPSRAATAGQDEGGDLGPLRRQNAELRRAISEALERAYESGDYGAGDLPTERMGIGEALIDILAAQAEFWQPIAMGPRPASAAEGIRARTGDGR